LRALVLQTSKITADDLRFHELLHTAHMRFRHVDIPASFGPQ
jgi:hypothetical protein